MKSIKTYLILTAWLIAACEDDLTKTPDLLPESAVFEQKELTDAYLAGLYESVRFIDLGGQANLNIGMISAAGAEHINFADWQEPNDTYTRTYSAATGAGPLDYWPYFNIRNVNFMLEKIALSSSFDKEFVQNRVAQARFVRAYEYFELVKRFGGVPIITKVQNQDDPEDELYTKRNKEQEVYDFIIAELQEIIPLFGAEKTGAKGKADKYASLALLSRAALYAGSIARNGEVYNEGVTGIPSGEANKYYQISYDASRQLLEAKIFSLYNKSEDTVLNYRELFIDNANSEIIFAEVFDPVLRGTSFDRLTFPDGFGSTWNSNFPVVYDFVELFDFVDGRKGTDIKRGDLTDKNSWKINDFFGKRDPRFRASVFYPESIFQGQKVYFHTQTTYTANGEKKTAKSGTLKRKGEDWPAASRPRNVRNSALLRRKWVDEGKLVPIGGDSGQDYIIFRLGETYLNWAEAAFYLERKSETIEALNKIRERVGMPLFTSVTEADIQQERQVELCFENQRFWDLIRWRTASKYLDKVRTKGLVFKYDMDNDTYNITLKNIDKNERIFGPERYYLPISESRLANNNKFVQNMGY